MNSDKKKEKVINNYNLGLHYFEAKDYLWAYNFFKYTYKLCIKYRDTEYLYQCAEKLVDTCYLLANEYIESAKSNNNQKSYHSAMKNLQKGYKVAQFGMEIETSFHETKNAQTLDKITDLIKLTNDYSYEDAVETAEQTKEDVKNLVVKCAHILATTGKIIVAPLYYTGKGLVYVMSKIGEYGEDVDVNTEDNSSKTDEEADLSPEEQADRLYTAGDDADTYDESIKYYKECYFVAKKAKLEKMQYNASLAVSNCYEALGDKEYNIGIDHYDNRTYFCVGEYMRKAMEYYQLAKNWDPILFNDRISEKYSSASHYEYAASVGGLED